MFLSLEQIDCFPYGAAGATHLSQMCTLANSKCLLASPLYLEGNISKADTGVTAVRSQVLAQSDHSPLLSIFQNQIARLFPDHDRWGVRIAGHDLGHD